MAVTVGDGVNVGGMITGAAVGGGKGFKAMFGSLMINTTNPNTATVRITKMTVIMSKNEALADDLSCGITCSQLTQLWGVCVTV